MRFTDLMITLPIILVAAVLGFVFGAHGVFVVGAVLGLLSWTGLTRLVRAEFLSLREREFVDAAKVAGASDRRIIFKHILPNAVGVIVVNMTLVMSGGILAEAALSFLGFGISFPDVSLGSLISSYQTAMLSGQPWLFLWPGVFIIIIVMCLNFLGDGLRDAFDPRQRRIPKAKDLRTTSGVVAVAEAATIEPVAEEDEDR
jgi:peptide/nickel transport system permease protein